MKDIVITFSISNYCWERKNKKYFVRQSKIVYNKRQTENRDRNKKIISAGAQKNGGVK